MEIKKQSVLFIFLLFVILILGGCKDYRSEYENTKNTETVENIIEGKSFPGGTVSSQAVSDKGLYYINNDRIFYCSFNTLKSIEWCSDSTCSHNNRDCSSFVGGTEYLNNYVLCDNDFVYKIARDENGAYLERFNSDGTNLVRIGKLWDKNSCFEEEAPIIDNGYIQIYNGKIYYLVNDDYKKCGLYSIDLKPMSQPQLLYEYDGEGNKVIVNDFVISEEYAGFFVSCSQGKERNQSTHVVDLIDGKSYIIDDLYFPYFGLHGSVLYFADTENVEDIVAYDVKTGERTKVVDVDSANKYEGYYSKIICADDYFLIDNDIEVVYGKMEKKVIAHTFRIYNYDGVLIKEIPAAGNKLFGFDGRMVIAGKIDGKILKPEMFFISNTRDEWNKVE